MRIWHICIFILLLVVLVAFISCEKTDFDYNLSIEKEDLTLNHQSEYIVVLGDIQKYTNQMSNLPYYKNTLNWIWSQYQYGYNIDCILQVGDVTNDNTLEQWERFRNVTDALANDILYVTCTGNHDYDWNENDKIYDRSSSLINSYADFPLTYDNIIAFYEKGEIENYVVLNEIFGERYDILVLEFGPRTEVVEWANDFVSSHPERKFILMTHEFLSSQGKRVSLSSYAEKQILNTTWSSPEDVWQKLVKDNDNIVCVLCGHNGFSAKLFSKNSTGREVPQILFNLQYLDNGGDGWMQLWEFPEHSDSVNVFVYNTIRRDMHPDPSTSFKFRYRY